MSPHHLFISQLLLALLVVLCHCHALRANDEPIPWQDGQPAQQLIPPNSTATFSYSSVLSSDSSLYVGLSKDSFDTALQLYLSWPDQPVNASYSAYQLLLARGADSGSVLYSVAPGNYTVLLVNSAPDSNVTATLVLSSRSVLAIPNTEPVAGACLAGGPLYYKLAVPQPVDNDVVLYVQPSNRQSYEYERGLSLYATHGAAPSAANATWSYPRLHWNDTATIRRDDPALLACAPPCTLYLAVDCATRQEGVQYRITTQEALGLLTVQPNQRLPAIEATAAKHYQLFLARPPTLHIAVELCDGDVTAYLSTTHAYPSTAADSVAYWTRPHSSPTFTLGGGALQNYTEYYLNVLPATPSASYELAVLQFDPAPLAPLVPPASTALTGATSGSVRFVAPSVASRYSGQAGLDVAYVLYLSDDSVNRTSRVAYTACGLRRSSNASHTFLHSQLRRGDDGTYELRWDDAGNPWPATANLVAYLVNASATAEQPFDAYPLVYTPASVPVAPSDDPQALGDHEAVVVAEVIASVFLPLFVLAACVALYLRWRTSKLEAELRLELPDVEVNDVNGQRANSAQRRQQRRQRERAGAEQVTRVRDASNSNRTSLLSDDSLSTH